MPFGETLYEEHSNTRDMPYKFNGKEKDEETGLYYYGARYYDPWQGQFYGSDPMRSKYPSLGSYTYCANNPVRLIDPSGMEIEEASLKDWNKQKVKIEKRLGKKSGEDRASLEKTIATMNDMESSTQVYGLNKVASRQGGRIFYDAKRNEENGGTIMLDYESTAFLVHEITHVGQYENKELAFDKATGRGLAHDVTDELEAYKAQKAYDKSTLPNKVGLGPNGDKLDEKWLMGIKKANRSAYSDIGKKPLNILTGRDEYNSAFGINKASTGFINIQTQPEFYKFKE